MAHYDAAELVPHRTISTQQRSLFNWQVRLMRIITALNITLVLALLVGLGGIRSGAEIMSCVRICWCCDVVGRGE